MHLVCGERTLVLQNELEIYAIEKYLKYFILFIFPHNFIIKSYYKGIQCFLTKNIYPTLDKHGKLTRWLIFIQKLEGHVKHIQGKDNTLSNQLS
jgi:hypothetical protein